MSFIQLTKEGVECERLETVILNSILENKELSMVEKINIRDFLLKTKDGLYTDKESINFVNNFRK